MLFLISSVFFDLLYEKIPNYMIAAGLLMGFLYRILIVHDRRIGVLFFDLLFPFFLFLVFFAIRAIGAGDVKLFMITGLFLGTEKNLICIGLTFLLAAVFGTVRLIRHHKLLSRIETLLLYGMELYKYLKYKGRGPIPYMTKERMDSVAKIHLSLPIFLGVVTSVFLIF